MLLSVIVPMYNEEEVAERTFETLETVLSGIEHELVFVNDGSRDKTREILGRLVAGTQHKLVNFSRNFGHQAAFTAGLDFASGQCVAIIDGDLQDPPEVLLEMLGKWREGYQVIYGQRRSRIGESWFKRATASGFYRILHYLTNIDIPVDTGDFRLMDRVVVDALRSLPERSRFIRGLVPWVGFRKCGLLYDRAERFAGITKYPLNKMVKLAFDGITSFSSAPLRLSVLAGIASTAVGFLVALWAIAQRLLDPGHTEAGWASLLVAVVFLGGIQLLTIGILGEYISRIYEEVKGRPIYIVDQPKDRS